GLSLIEMPGLAASVLVGWGFFDPVGLSAGARNGWLAAFLLGRWSPPAVAESSLIRFPFATHLSCSRASFMHSAIFRKRGVSIRFRICGRKPSWNFLAFSASVGTRYGA